MSGPEYQKMEIRKIPDKSRGERLTRFDPETGRKFLVNPANGRQEGWPLAGMQFEGDPPKLCRVPHSWVLTGIDEGWIVAENYRTVTSPGGPPERPWDSRRVHNFPQADFLTLNCKKCGGKRYKVTLNPGKFFDEDGALVGADNIKRYGEAATVRWFFELELQEK